MKVTLEYGTHHYIENYEYAPHIHCVDCGKLSVWVDEGFGDYYEGPNHLCIECNCEFTLPSNSKANEEYLGIIKQIRQGKQDLPVSKRGN